MRQVTGVKGSAVTMKRMFFLGQAFFLGSARWCLLASHSNGKLMSLFSVTNSPLLVYCAAETSQFSGLGSLATKGHCLFFLLLLVFINLPSADLSKKVKVRQVLGRNGSLPSPFLGARRHLQCLVHTCNAERNLQGNAQRLVLPAGQA